MREFDIPDNLTEAVNAYSEQLLKNSEDISLLVNLCRNSGINFSELAFNGKYIKGLRIVISRISITGDEYKEKIFKEFTESTEKLSSRIKKIIETSGTNQTAYFEQKYFSMNQESIANLMSLIDDLSLCKEYLNKTESSKD